MEKMVYLVTSTFNAEDRCAEILNSEVNTSPQIFATKEAAEAELWNRINTRKERWENARHIEAIKQAVMIVEDKPNHKEVWFSELYAEDWTINYLNDDEANEYLKLDNYDYGVRMTALPLE